MPDGFVNGYCPACSATQAVFNEDPRSGTCYLCGGTIVIPVNLPPSTRPRNSRAAQHTRDRSRGVFGIILIVCGLPLVAYTLAVGVAQGRREVGVRTAIKGLRDPDAKVRVHAAVVLRALKDPRAVEPLIGSLKDPEVRSAASDALGEIGTPAVAPLISVLRDPTIRHSVVEALGKIGTPAVESLVTALKDPVPEVRKGAADALGDAYELNNAFDELRAETGYSGFRNAGDIRADPRPVEPLIGALGDPAPGVRLSAFSALIHYLRNNPGKDSRAAGALLAALKEGGVTTATVYGSVIGMGLPGAEDVLIEALSKSGDKPMAEMFLNCGNSKLASAASDWAWRHGYQITTMSGGQPATWGGR